MKLSEEFIISLENRIKSLESRDINKTIKDSVKADLEEWLVSSLSISCIKEEINRRYKHGKVELNGLGKIVQKVEMDLSVLQTQMVSLQEDQSKDKKVISSILNDLKSKADITDLSRIERLANSKCPMNGLDEINRQLKLMADAEALSSTQKSLKATQEKIESEYFRRDEALKSLENLQKSFTKSLGNYSTLDQTLKLSQKFYKKSVAQNIAITAISDSLSTHTDSFDKSLKDLKYELTSKASNKDLEKFLQGLNEKASKSELIKSVQDLSPKILAFQSELGIFNRILREQEESILNLDREISQKASKLETHDLYEKLDQLSRHSDLEFKIDDMIRRQSEVQVRIDDIASENRQMVLKVAEIQTLFSKKSNDMTEVKFLKELMLDMQTSISYKADRNEMLNCLEQKAGWGDFNHLTQSLDSVHKQIKLLAVQVGALEKITTPNGKMRNAERTQREYFNKITNRLVNYVVGSKPTIEEPTIPEEIKAYMKLPFTPKITEQKLRISTPNKKTHYSFDQDMIKT